jgi:hypothetical protein
MKKTIYLSIVAALVSSVCLPSAYAKDYITASNIQKVNLEDSFDDVIKKIGEPQQVLSKEFTGDGKEQVIWLYETIKPFREERTPIGVLSPSRTASAASVYFRLRAQNPPYLITFINGKVAKIERQKIEAVPTAQVDVANY